MFYYTTSVNCKSNVNSMDNSKKNKIIFQPVC